ncbi:hypothetical protein C1Y63_03315 [Corynebacterium sp. 13CS0277]|nr:hypothetical protein C1Y63_03315 [Corynebacterium sp. 13CS0277]
MHSGHADFGPLFHDGALEIKIRDDTVVPPVWRDPNDVVFVLGAAAENRVPDSADYGLTGADPGQLVWAIPQNQVADVPWLGWNTQAPSFLDTHPTGMTLSVTGHQGPGTASLFLQSGTFEAPQALVDGRKVLPQSMWIEPNTHVHANWVFSDPGVHVLTLQADVDYPTGPPQTVTTVLRFAVGDTDPQLALAATVNDPAEPAPAAMRTPEATAALTDIADGDSDRLLWLGLGAGCALVLLVAVIVWARSRGTRGAAWDAEKDAQPSMPEATP